MDFLVTLTDYPISLQPPSSLTGWGLLAILALAIYLRLNNWEREKRPSHRWEIPIFILLTIITAGTSLFFGVQIGNTLLFGEGIEQPAGIPIMLFSSIPWVISAAIFSPLPTVILASLSGVIYASFFTHSPLTIFEYAILSILYLMAFRNNRKGSIYRILRNPFGASVLTILLFAPMHLVNSVLYQSSFLLARLDYGFNTLPYIVLDLGITLFLASLVVTGLHKPLAEWWVKPKFLQPAILQERTLENRFFSAVGPLILIVLFGMLVASWLIAGNAARQSVRENLESTASTAADSIPYFLETGEDLVTQFANNIKLGKLTQF
jgi:hypothetical protein